MEKKVETWSETVVHTVLFGLLMGVVSLLVHDTWRDWTVAVAFLTGGYFTGRCSASHWRR